MKNERLEKRREYMRIYLKAYYARKPEYRKKVKEGVAHYRTTEKGKSYVKEYRSRPEVKKRYKLWVKDIPNYHRDYWRNIEPEKKEEILKKKRERYYAMKKEREDEHKRN